MSLEVKFACDECLDNLDEKSEIFCRSCLDRAINEAYERGVADAEMKAEAEEEVE